MFQFTKCGQVRKKIYLLLLVLAQPSILQYVSYDIIIGECSSEGWTVKSFDQPDKCSTWNCSPSQKEYIQFFKTFISKTFLLIPHYKISIKGTFYGYYTSNYAENIHIFCDNTLLSSQCDKQYIDYCSSYSYTKYKLNYTEQQLYHTSNSLTILIYNNYRWWVKDSLQLNVYYCNPGCQFCQFSPECQNYQYVPDLNINILSPLQVIEGYQNGIPSQKSQYTIKANGLQIQGLESGQNVGNLFQKQIYINIRGEVRISFKALTRNLLSYKIKILINEQVVTEQSQSNFKIPNLCVDGVYLMQQFQYSFLNNQDLMSLGIQYYDLTPQCAGYDIFIYFGIRDLEIYYNQQECQDENLLPFDGCHQKLYSCVEGCKECLRGKCQECVQGFVYIEQTKQCFPFCGDRIIQLNEQCDDGNNVPYDGCFQCKFSCPLNCSICRFGICHKLIQKDNYNQIINFIENGFTQHQIVNDQNYKYQNSLKKINCKSSDFTLFGFFYSNCLINNISWCKVNYFQSCFECFEGYELDFNKQFCKAKCNDGYLEELEQCDDNNNIQFDGCYKCQNNCQKECQVCERSKCLKCFDGWNLNSGSCYQICGDGLLAIGSYEQCDDGNDVSEDGCFQCKIECSSNCASCSSNQTCEICEDFYIQKNNYCYPHCGDKNVLQGIEECDDGNNIEFDGCYNCHYSCPQVCSLCEKGICLQKCDSGFYFNTNNQDCESYCGDQIVASNEDCDDGNDIEFDGCYNCQNSCSAGCNNCQNGKCFKCVERYKFESYQCIDICGNGMRDIREECDDDNNVNGDGCESNCLIENDFFCLAQLDSISECVKKPLLKLTYLSKSFDIQFVQITFTEQLKDTSLNFSFIEPLSATVIQLNSQQYEIEIIPIIELTNDEFLYGEYKIKIRFEETIVDYQNLEISFNKELILVDKNDIIFDWMKNHTIQLQPAYVLDENQIYISQQFYSFGKSFILGLGACSLLLLVSGYFFQFFNILDILQYQAYFRYLNLNFPQNVFIYFSTYDYITLQPILDYLQVNNFFSLTIGEEYLESIYKFKLYEINADLITNVYVQLIQFILGGLIIIFLQFYKNFYFTKCFTSKHFKFLNSQDKHILKQIALLIYKLNNYFFEIENSLSSKGIKQIFLLNSWDLTFKVFLFIASNQNLGARESFSYITCSLYYAYTIFYFVTFYKRKIRKVDLIHSRRDRHQAIILIKKILFLFVLINFQTTPTLQGLLEACIQSFYIGLIITKKLTENKIETKMILITELPLLFFTISALSYSPDFTKYISEESKVNLGFAQIGVLLFGLLAPFMNQINFFFQKVKQYFQKKYSLYYKQQTTEAKEIFGISVQTLISPKK